MSFPDPQANQFDPVQPPKKSSSAVKIILILAAVFGVIGLICAGLCGWGVYVGYNAGMDAAGEQMKIELRDNPVILEHIGNIESVRMNLRAVIELAQEQQAAGGAVQQGTVVFDIQGDKGEGQLTITVPPGGQPGQFQEGTLRMSTGEEYDLEIGPTDMEGDKLDMEDAMDMDADAEDF